MPQFVIDSENIKNNEIFITDKDDIKHISNVLRCNPGNKLTLIELDKYIYQTEITNIKKDCIETKILNKEIADKKLHINITLAQSIIKSHKQDYIIQKSTELGVNRIIPFISKNTVVKIHSEKDNFQKVDRWLKIVHESVKQCERANIPQISHIISFNELIEINDFDVKLVCTERDTNLSIKEFLRNNPADKSKEFKILLIVGPEGGWDNSELAIFKEKNIPQVTLGKLILRAETAVTTALADIIYEYEL